MRWAPFAVTWSELWSCLANPALVRHSLTDVPAASTLPPDIAPCDANFRVRYDHAVRYIVPFLRKAGRLGKQTVLEVGCGRGPKSLALAPHVERYVGFDIDPESIEHARRYAELLGVSNVEFVHLEAAEIENLFGSEPFDLILLYAVLEHLTVSERLSTLTAIWQALKEGGALYVAEAPNRIAPVDYHSSRLPYFHNLPLSLAERRLAKSSNVSWISRVRSEESLELGFFRNGQHIGYEEFEETIAPLGDMSTLIAADGFSQSLLNLNPLRWFEPRLLEDFAGHPADPRVGIDSLIPPAFARYWIDMLLIKGGVAENERQGTPVFYEPERDPARSRPRDILRVPVTPLWSGRPEVAFHPSDVTAPLNAGSTVTVGLSKRDSRGNFRILDNGEREIASLCAEDVKMANADDWQPQSFITVPAIGHDLSRLVIQCDGDTQLSVAALFRC